MIIQAWHQREFVTAGLLKNLPTPHAYFFEGLQAVRNKRGADYRQTLDARFRQALDFFVGVRLHPRLTSQSRLKRDRITSLRQFGPAHERSDGFVALCAVAGRMRRTRHFAAILHLHAMALCRVRFTQMSLRKSVEAEQQVVMVLLQIAAGT